MAWAGAADADTMVVSSLSETSRKIVEKGVTIIEEIGGVKAQAHHQPVEKPRKKAMSCWTALL